jgi:enoyl-CoA hydratase/carnithine racemase
MNNFDSVIFEIRDHIGIITLNLPPENYLTIPGFIPLNLFEQWTGSEELKGIIIKGQGRNFSAGGKIDQVFRVSIKPHDLQKLVDEGIELLDRIQNLEIPGGLEIALACHIRVASENALLAFPEANQNLMPGMGGTVRLPATIGWPYAVTMILGGDMVNAVDGKKLGLIDYIAPKDEAFEFAFNIMQKMTRARPVKVIRSIMKSLKNSRLLKQDEAMAEETKLFCGLAIDEAIRRKKEEA